MTERDSFKTLTFRSTALPTGTLLAGRYEILEKLGQGGMGVVYKAHDRRLDRDVALKFLPPGLLSDTEAKERFLREARAAAALDHPHICAVHEVDEVEGTPFISMSFVEGESLRAMIERGPIAPPTALDLAVQIADGLHAAHLKGIVHRDIKPANIMVTPGGQAKIMDFGLAKVRGAALMTQTGTTMGTVAYMSPEQARGAEVDLKTDLWSLGVVLYQCLSGCLPFSGDHEHVILLAIVNKVPRPLTDVCPNLPPVLDDVVRRAMRKKPEERFQSAAEMRTALEAARNAVGDAACRTRPSLLREAVIRRVPHILGGYLAASFGVLFLTKWLVNRFVLSPHLPAFCVAALLSLAPTVVLLAAIHGRGGRRRWIKAEKFGIPLNLAVSAAVLFLLFNGKSLGAATETLRLKTEDGQTVERIVPKREFRKKFYVFFFDNESGDATLDWMQYAFPALLRIDLYQDLYLDVWIGFTSAQKMKEAGFPDGVKLPLALKMKIAGDAKAPYFISGSFARKDRGVLVKTALYETGRAKRLTERVYERPDIFGDVDAMSEQIKQDLGIPSRHIEETKDMPVMELTTASPAALKLYIEGLKAEYLDGDWKKKLACYEQAAAADPTFALAQGGLFSAAKEANQAEVKDRAFQALMTYLYKLPEREQYTTKIAFFLEKNEMSKALTVARMAVDVFPDDIAARVNLAALDLDVGKRDEALAEYKRVLEIDPEQYWILQEIGGLHGQMGDTRAALASFEKYASHFPNAYASYAPIAELFEKTGDYERAKATYEKALTVEPGRTKGQLSLAHIEMKLGHFSRAEDMLRDIIAKANTEAERAEVFPYLSSLFEMRGQLRKALEFGRSYLAVLEKTEPPLQVMLTRLGYVPLYIKTGQKDVALSLIEAVKKRLAPPLDLMVPQFYLAFDLAIEDVGGAEKDLAAVEASSSVLPLPDLKSIILHSRGRIHELKGEYGPAIQCFEDELKDAPDNLRSQVMLARCYRLNREPRKGESQIQNVLKIHPFDAETHYELAMISWDLGQKDKAREHLRVALDVWKDADPDFLPALKARETAKAWETS